MKKINFIPGLGEKPREYKALSKYLNIVDIDWNKGKMNIGKVDVLVGFSIGAELACDYTLKHKVKTLILCSLTPGSETLVNIKADKVIFLVGGKEKWVLKDLERVRKTLECKNSVTIVPGVGHRITGQYQKKLLEIVGKVVKNINAN